MTVFDEKWMFLRLFCRRRTAATRSTSAHRMYRCTPTTTARIRPSSRRVSSDTAPPKTAPHRTAPSPDSAPRTSTAGAAPAITHSRTKPTWVPSSFSHSNPVQSHPRFPYRIPVSSELCQCAGPTPILILWIVCYFFYYPVQSGSIRISPMRGLTRFDSKSNINTMDYLLNYL